MYYDELQRTGQAKSQPVVGFFQGFHQNKGKTVFRGTDYYLAQI
jgi:hypothetical protein